MADVVRYRWYRDDTLLYELFVHPEIEQDGAWRWLIPEAADVTRIERTQGDTTIDTPPSWLGTCK